jgi:hypothetical protein
VIEFIDINAPLPFGYQSTLILYLSRDMDAQPAALLLFAHDAVKTADVQQMLAEKLYV